MSDFYHLPTEQQEEYLKQLAEKALACWGLDGSLRLIKHRENAVFELRTDSGEQYAVRIHRANYHSDQSLKSELQWIGALKEYGLGVPEVIPTQAGDYFTLVETPEVPEPRQVDLLAWVKGSQIGSIEEGLSDAPEAIQANYLRIGQQAAMVHNQASEWQTPEGFQRHAWDAEGLVGNNPFWGQFWELAALTDEQRVIINNAREQVRVGLNAFGQDTEDYSMIHADFVPENVMVDGDKVEIIDFDDAGFGWHLFELATALYFIQEDPNYEIAKQALIEGYRQHRPLSDEKLAKLPLFMVARSFTYLGWVHTRSETETAKELTPMLVELSISTINQSLAD